VFPNLEIGFLFKVKEIKKMRGGVQVVRRTSDPAD